MVRQTNGQTNWNRKHFSTVLKGLKGDFLTRNNSKLATVSIVDHIVLIKPSLDPWKHNIRLKVHSWYFNSILYICLTPSTYEGEVEQNFHNFHVLWKLKFSHILTYLTFFEFQITLNIIIDSKLRIHWIRNVLMKIVPFLPPFSYYYFLARLKNNNLIFSMHILNLKFSKVIYKSMSMHIFTENINARKFSCYQII